MESIYLPKGYTLFSLVALGKPNEAYIRREISPGYEKSCASIIINNDNTITLSTNSISNHTFVSAKQLYDFLELSNLPK